MVLRRVSKQVRPLEPFNTQDGISPIYLQTDPDGRTALYNGASRRHGHLHSRILQKPMAKITSWPSWPTLHRKPTCVERKADLVNFYEMEQTIWWVGLSIRSLTLQQTINYMLGPIMHVNVLGQPLIVFNTHKATADLLERRAAIYSDRPPNIVCVDMMTGGNLFSLAGSDVYVYNKYL